jgi:hypothetical protein
VDTDDETSANQRRDAVNMFWRLVVLLVLGASSLGVASAQTQAPERKAGEVKSEVRKTTTRRTAFASGTVKSASGDAVVVAGSEKGKETEWTFAVDVKTMIKANGKSIVATDLKPGDAVQVRYSDEDGKALAHTIRVKAAAAAKSKAGKPAVAEPVDKK